MVVHIIFQQDFSCLAVLLPARLNQNFNYRGFTFFAWLSQNHSLILILSCCRLRFLRFRSSLLSESLLLSFPLPTKIFQFGRSCLHCWILGLLPSGFSHSDSCGSTFTYNSPQRFAVRRVLLRLLVPRHPLYALFSLTFLFFDYRLKFILSTFQRSLFWWS